MDELLRLAARCEAAEGADAELFEDVFAAVFPKPSRSQIWAVEGVTWTEEYAAYMKRQHRFYDLIEAEAYLDAALTLVPDGVETEINRWANGAGAVEIWIDGQISRTGEAATPALALCAASLRARTQANPTDGGK